jgi:3'-phosphoadenosine 5'-phosphosulfate sulfotransferase (PAPS reductase)/FAD synthetase
MDKVRLKIIQKYDLKTKIMMSDRRIAEWFQHWGGKVSVSFSGGKDSTVLLHLVRKQFPDVPAVFVDTGLEYPEIRRFVRQFENVIWLKPKTSFRKVIEQHGYPVVSRRVSRFVNDLQNPSEKNRATRNLRLTGYNKKGTYCPSMRLPKKWLHLADAPFKISDRCCDILKKRPLNNYSRRTKSRPFVGVMASDSHTREWTYLQTGCNAFDAVHPISKPMAFWMEHDVLEYITKYKIPYCNIYGKIKNVGGVLKTTKVNRTGCIFCCFGVHMQKGENRFQQLAKTHPRLHNYCINKLGIGKILEFLNVPYG